MSRSHAMLWIQNHGGKKNETTCPRDRSPGPNTRITVDRIMMPRLNFKLDVPRAKIKSVALQVSSTTIPQDTIPVYNYEASSAAYDAAKLSPNSASAEYARLQNENLTLSRAIRSNDKKLRALYEAHSFLKKSAPPPSPTKRRFLSPPPNLPKGVYGYRCGLPRRLPPGWYERPVGRKDLDVSDDEGDKLALEKEFDHE
ncbi:hypothetical protein CYLTODRAFT_479612 [Cylindrobasidium torrendii FP15055 ss-10]|uniref:Uncharacterized protein n=1 Tax=Cylindrobasidium torrendii FP15055 ss-10 TaxID=1314674 RepID=A0A0D7AVA2_9AGAR|nr:hypothetical protein CYLTODRAFT_479612 [Cylindrobasidium torrendii FP15055 ss-10]